MLIFSPFGDIKKPGNFSILFSILFILFILFMIPYKLNIIPLFAFILSSFIITIQIIELNEFFNTEEGVIILIIIFSF